MLSCGMWIVSGASSGPQFLTQMWGFAAGGLLGWLGVRAGGRIVAGRWCRSASARIAMSSGCREICRFLRMIGLMVASSVRGIRTVIAIRVSDPPVLT